ncbi:MAG: AI-2E family transporter [Myxococcota bacterium]
MAPSNQERPQAPFALLIITTLLVGCVLYLMQPVVLPLILALFFSALARPLQLRLQKFLPSWAALILTVLVAATILVALPVLFASNLQAVIEKAPTYAPRLQEIARDVAHVFQDAGFGDASQMKIGSEGNWFVQLAGGQSSDVIVKVMTAMLQGAFDFLGQVAIVVFMMVFVLSEANIFREKLAIALKPTNLATVMESFASMQDRIQQYVQTKTLFSALNATAAGVFTWVLGMDFPIIWGLLTFILYFIPTFGTLIATIPPVLLALVQFESPTTAIVCLIGLIVIFNLLGNVVEPRFLGRTLSLSPLVVFVSLIFWGWYFDVVGFVLSVPLTVVLGIVCEHIPMLRPIAVLIADKPRRLGSDEPAAGEHAR